MRRRPVFDDIALREEFRQRLQAAGVTIPDSKLNLRPSFRLDILSRSRRPDRDRIRSRMVRDHVPHPAGPAKIAKSSLISAMSSASRRKAEKLSRFPVFSLGRKSTLVGSRAGDDEAAQVGRSGQMAGDIVLRGRLGEGGMGTVYFGVTPDGDRVAVKTIRQRPDRERRGERPVRPGDHRPRHGRRAEDRGLARGLRAGRGAAVVRHRVRPGPHPGGVRHRTRPAPHHDGRACSASCSPRD